MAEVRIHSDGAELHHTTPSLRQALEEPTGCDNPSLLVVSPHDDDALIGAGITLQQALEEGISIHVGIVTDGSQGYSSSLARGDIKQMRFAETREAYGQLGMDEKLLTWLGYPDTQTWQNTGRRFVGKQSGRPVVAEHSGLGNSLPHLMRMVKPTHVFSVHPGEFHPDHQAVSNAVRIALQHAACGIWPELGERLPKVPELLEFPVGAQLEKPATHAVWGSPEQLERKLAAIACYKTQADILGTVAGIRRSGAFEFFRLESTSYDPEADKARFGL